MFVGVTVDIDWSLKVSTLCFRQGWLQRPTLVHLYPFGHKNICQETEGKLFISLLLFYSEFNRTKQDITQGVGREKKGCVALRGLAGK